LSRWGSFPLEEVAACAAFDLVNMVVVAIWDMEGSSSGVAALENGESGGRSASLKGLGVLPCCEWKDSCPGALAWLRLGALGVCAPLEVAYSPLDEVCSSPDEGAGDSGDDTSLSLMLMTTSREAGEGG
jgi:hypothetical protein